jgi:hypothetical protein
VKFELKVNAKQEIRFDLFGILLFNEKPISDPGHLIGIRFEADSNKRQQNKKLNQYSAPRSF